MKLLVIINTILSFFAFIQFVRSFLISRTLQKSLERVDKEELVKTGLIYLLSKDKAALQDLARVALLLLAVATFTTFTWNLSVILQGFVPYATKWVDYTATIYYVSKALAAHFTYMIYNRNNLSFLKWYKK